MAQNNWSEVILRDLVDVKHGFAFQGEYFTDEETRDILLTPGNFAIGGGYKGDKLKYYFGEPPEEYVLSSDDLIVTMTDLSKNMDTLGYSALVPAEPNKRFLHNQRLGRVIIRDEKQVDKYFLYYLLRTNDYRNEVKASASGSVIKHTSPDRIRNYQFLLPPLPEQRAIAGILGALDDKIELNRRMNRTLESMARAVFRQWFVEGEEVGDWEVGRLGDFIGVNERSINKDYSKDEIEYIDISSVSVGHLEGTTLYPLKDAPSRARRLVQHGDTIWSTVRPNRKSYLFIDKPNENLVVSTGFAVLTPKTIPPSFLYFFTTTEQFVDYLVSNADGSAYPAVLAERFADAEFPLPPANMMKKFEEIASPMLAQIAHNEKESRTLASLRDSLLPKLMRGEVRVKAQR